MLHRLGRFAHAHVTPAAAAAAAAAAVTSSACFAVNSHDATVSCTGSGGGGTSCDDSSRPKLLFLGSGSSTGCPKPLCALAFPDDTEGADTVNESYGHTCSCRDTSTSKKPQSQDDPSLTALQEQLGKSCRTSKLAAIGDPRNNKNYRNNPSILISHRNNDNDETFGTYGEDEVPVRNVVIDCGKTFRETALRWMPSNNIRSLDAVVLTHEHMDAIAGLDDIRGFQRRSAAGVMESTPIFLSQQCLEAIKRQFHYLVPADPFRAHNGQVANDAKSGTKVVRAVASLQFNLIERFQPFVAAGLRMIPLPVMHGEDLVCLGFAFRVDGATKNSCKNESSGAAGGLNVVYLSDISRMLPETEDYILNKLPPIDVLIIDSLLVARSHPVHYSLKQAISLARRLKPKKTYVVGMNCDDFKPHEETNEELRLVENLDIELAYDGLVIDVPTSS